MISEIADLTRDRLVELRGLSEDFPLPRHYTVGFAPSAHHSVVARSPSDIRTFMIPRERLPTTTGVSKGFDPGEYLVRGDIPLEGATVIGPTGSYAYELPLKDLASYSPLLKSLLAERLINKGLGRFPDPLPVDLAYEVPDEGSLY